MGCARSAARKSGKDHLEGSHHRVDRRLERRAFAERGGGLRVAPALEARALRHPDPHSARLRLHAGRVQAAEMSATPPARVRRFSRRAQMLLVLGVALAIALLAAGAAALRHFMAPQKPKPAASAPGTFRPTKEQWAGLKVVPVQTRAFRTEQIT